MAPNISIAAMNEISDHIWPKSANRNNDGALVISGLDVRDISQKYPTPLFVLDETDLINRVQKYMKSFSKASHGSKLTKETKIFYASKAFTSSLFIKLIVNEGMGVDVASEGELRVALAGGCKPENIVFHGNNKSVDELAFAIDKKVGLFAVDSFFEIARLAQLAIDKNVKPNVLVRVTAGIEAHTHEFVATAHEDQKFGFSLAAGDADEAVRRIVKDENLHLVGLHSHIGSQIFDNKGFEIAATRLAELALRIAKEHNVQIEMLNLGGGMGIAYIDSDAPLAIEQMSSELVDIVYKLFTTNGLAMPQLAFEPGRAIVGPSMITLYTVGTTKKIELENGEKRTYIAVDGGMSDNIRTALYGAQYSVTLASRLSKAEPMLSRIVGKHCESGDIIVRDCYLPEDLVPGDLIAVAATGAYNRSMSSQYNLVTRPGVISVNNNKITELLRKETYEDVFITDPGL
jgi:diaminopimelate decarboxylase